MSTDRARTSAARRAPRLFLAGVIVVLLGMAGRAALSSLEVKAPPDWLGKLATDTAVQMGDSEPASGEWALSDAATLSPLVGTQGGDSGSPEYLVILTGQFTDKMAFIPSGQPDPSGTILVLTVDSNTHMIQDLQVTDQRPDTSSLTGLFALPLVAPTG